MVPHVLGLIGLIANTIGAALLLVFPPAVKQYTSKGEPHVEWSGPASPSGRRAYVNAVWGFRLAIVLLVVGFVLQAVDLIIG